ncbi:MAG TPA: HlyD family secretion protein [Polyangiaceae bacterium]
MSSASQEVSVAGSRAAGSPAAETEGAAVAAPDGASAPSAARSTPRTGSKRKVVLGIVAVLAAAGFAYWLYERRFEETDDAQIDANMSSVSPRVSGTLSAVYVLENQRVKAGDLLAEIDPRDLDVAVALAKAQVAEAEAQLRVEDPSVSITEMSNKTTVATTGSDLASAQAALATARKSVDQLVAQLAQAKANDANVQKEKDRASQLIKQGAITQSEYDQRTSAADASSANVDAIQQSLEAARAAVGEQEARIASSQSRLAEAKANAPRQLETRKASVLWRQAALDAAKAQLAQAELNLSYTKIIAPVAGIVGKKAIAVGDHVAPGQQLLAIAEVDSVWVTANFRETQLKKVHPGLAATVHVDALELDLNGSVESIAGATGSRFSVLPPENASGNYVKVVQRIPVRIKIDGAKDVLDRLRPGMSVEPQVRVE